MKQKLLQNLSKMFKSTSVDNSFKFQYQLCNATVKLKTPIKLPPGHVSQCLITIKSRCNNCPYNTQSSAIALAGLIDEHT